MSDIRCPRCCEPWDIDEIHQYVLEVVEMFPAEVERTTFKNVYRLFRSEGCGVAFDAWEVSCEPDRSGRGAVLRSLGDLLGDDVDGFAALCEDFDMQRVPVPCEVCEERLEVDGGRCDICGGAW